MWHHWPYTVNGEWTARAPSNRRLAITQKQTPVGFVARDRRHESGPRSPRSPWRRDRSLPGLSLTSENGHRAIRQSFEAGSDRGFNGLRPKRRGPCRLQREGWNRRCWRAVARVRRSRLGAANCGWRAACEQGPACPTRDDDRFILQNKRQAPGRQYPCTLPMRGGFTGDATP